MKPAMKYGLISGAFAIVWSLLMYITELNRSDSAQIINIISLAFTILFMVLAINEYRTTEGNGWITFGKAFSTAFKVGLIGGIIGVAFYYLYITAIDPAFIDYQKQMQMEKMAEKGMDEETIELGMKQAAFFMTPGMQVIFGMIFWLFISALLSLVVAAVKKHPNPEEIA
jgi:Protein of unknown function (DUF4199)